MLRLFVYGTLKRGGRFHRQYCQGLKEAWEATVVGRLYLLPQGYPMLVVPPQSILTVATGEPIADLQIQEEWSNRLNMANTGDASWAPIHGEVLAFEDASAVLPGIDDLEEFMPGGQCNYHRVLVMPEPASIGPVWTYVAPQGRVPSGATLISSGRWEGK